MAESRSAAWTVIVMLAAWLTFVVVISVVLVTDLWLLGWSIADVAALRVPPPALVAMTAYQFVAMAGLSLLTARWVARRRRGRAAAGAILGIAWVPAPVVLLAGVVGLAVGWLPGLLADWIQREWPWLTLGSVDLVGQMLTDGPIASRVAMVATVALLGPLAEELMFRGVLFDAIERAGGPIVAVLGTTVLFGLVHMDPSQGIPLLVTGAWFGTIRAVTGSVWPAVACHVANNALAVALPLFGVDEAVSLPTALLLTAAAFCGLIATHRVQRAALLAG
jgi:membrane protease YdiL (CAAX protease family)